jgi:hypothetical protein
VLPAGWCRAASSSATAPLPRGGGLQQLRCAGAAAYLLPANLMLGMCAPHLVPYPFTALGKGVAGCTPGSVRMPSPRCLG